MNNDQDSVIYPSKVDLIMPVGLGMSLLMSIAFSAVAMNISGIVIMTICCALFFWGFMKLISSTSYTINNDTKRLIIKSPFTNRDYNLLKIKSIKQSTSILSNTTSSSLDRISIHFSNEELILSPKDKSGFVTHVQRLHPDVMIEFKGKKNQNAVGSSK